MSVKKFKIGDKVKVRKGLVPDKFYDGVLCNNPMARMGGAILTINYITSRHYDVEECIFCWSDEMLEPAEKTLYNLEKGDMVCNSSGTSEILVAIDGCYLLSHPKDDAKAGNWYTAADLLDYDYKLVKPETEIETGDTPMPRPYIVDVIHMPYRTRDKKVLAVYIIKYSDGSICKFEKDADEVSRLKEELVDEGKH